MKIFADYHTHTTYTHGKGTAEENVLAAIAKGLTRVAITEHGPGHKLYGVKTKRFTQMRREVDALNEKYAGRIEVLLGLELNLLSLDGETDCPSDADAKLFDLFLMGYHRGILPKSGLLSFTILSRAKSAISRNTDAYTRAIERYPISIVSHPGEYIPLDIPKLAKAAALAGTALEINASHAVTTLEHVELAKAQGALFALGSDAHSPERVGVFDGALRVALGAGLGACDIVNALAEDGGSGVL